MDRNDAEEAYFKGLNPNQKEAATSTEGPVLVIAGAGAGKTKTIVARITHLIAQGIPPENIVAITFTNKAATEMRDRVRAALQREPVVNRPISMEGTPFVSTFHSLCVFLLRENAARMSLPRFFSIFDRSESKQAIKESLREAGYDPKNFEPGKILGIISRAKGDGFDREAYAIKFGDDYLGNVVQEVWEKYDKNLREEKALDFDDLLLKAVHLLEQHPEVRNSVTNRWKYLHVDEYQDTNKIQYELVRLLAGEKKNVFAVGDIDQTIYTWRGARIHNLLGFEKDFPKTKIVLLEENYRSTQNIIEAANAVIKKNRVRVDKTLRTSNPPGEKFGVYAAYDEADEATFVASKARALIESGIDPGEIAVLFRANFQSRVLEEAFLNSDLPYQVLGTRFYERKEVKDLLSYLRLALSPDSPKDLRRVLNVPARGLGKLSLLKILAGKEGELGTKAREELKNFRNIITAIRKEADHAKPSDIVKFALKKSGLEQEFSHKNEEEKERLENLRELASLATRYDSENGVVGIEHLLTDADLGSDQDELREDKRGVRLMTVHAAKGLEFDNVFVTGLEDGLFPHREQGSSEEEREEERRLFYVAITRARKKVFLSYASTRTIFGLRAVNLPSEFLIDIDESLTEAETEGQFIKTIYLE